MNMVKAGLTLCWMAVLLPKGQRKNPICTTQYHCQPSHTNDFISVSLVGSPRKADEKHCTFLWKFASFFCYVVLNLLSRRDKYKYGKRRGVCEEKQHRDWSAFNAFIFSVLSATFCLKQQQQQKSSTVQKHFFAELSFNLWPGYFREVVVKLVPLHTMSHLIDCWRTRFSRCLSHSESLLMQNHWLSSFCRSHSESGKNNHSVTFSIFA